MLLQNINAHVRDANIVFEEEPHEYYLNGEKVNTSVTTVVHNMFPEFDSEHIAEKVMKKNYNNESSEYRKKSVKEIIEMWETNKTQSAQRGTDLHYAIEMYYNSLHIPTEQLQTTEWSYFMQFVNDNPQLKIYRTEWFVYDESINIAGSIDAIFKNDDGTYDIYDWKRSKNIQKCNKWENALHPIDHIPNTNYWQLNMYKRILETKYDKQVSNLFIIVLHENNMSYQKHRLPIMTDEIDTLYNIRSS